MKRIAITVIFALLAGLHAREIRPVRDDIGYCWEKQQVEKLMNYLRDHDDNPPVFPQLIAGIFPHDDYLYAGSVYYSLFSRVRTREAVIFGVTHSTVRKEIGDPDRKLIFDAYPFWQGPMKAVRISSLREFLKSRLSPEYWISSNQAHKLEHSIEAAIPFLQYFNPDIQLTPIMVTGMSFDDMDLLSEALSDLMVSYIRKKNLKLGRDIIFLISADANHYGEDFNNTPFGTDDRSHEQGTTLDRHIIETCLINQISKEKINKLTGMLWGKTFRDNANTLWCGKYSIPLGLLTIYKIVNKLDDGAGLRGGLFRYADTYSNGVLPLKKPGYGITAPFSLKHWVSFFSAGFWLE